MARSKVKKVANAEIRAAKTFLNKKGLTSHGQPYYGWLTAVLAAIFNFANNKNLKKVNPNLPKMTNLHTK